MLNEIREGKAKIKASVGKISKKLEVFYNPIMKFNRDISILLLDCVENKDLQVGSPLAGSGVREVRFLLELKKIKKIYVNDYSENAVKAIKENIKLNKISSKKIEVSMKDANLFLLESKGFDYIDIDPFGTPNPFLDAAVKRISRNGILAVTATDTSALSGTFPDACLRKYWAKPSHDYVMHEVGLRILIRKVQLVGAQFDKALIPIFSYSKDHYMRVFLRIEKGKEKVDWVLGQHGVFNSCGPMWLGELWDTELTKKMYSISAELDYDFDSRFLQTIVEESKVGTVGFHDIHELCGKNHLEVPNFEAIFNEVKKKGYTASRTHFSPYGLRSGISEKELIAILKKIAKN